MDKTGLGRRKDVGVKEDQELNLEEIEVSHTLGGSGRCYVNVISENMDPLSKR